MAGILAGAMAFSTFAAATPVQAATLSATQYFNKMSKAVDKLKSYELSQTTVQKMDMSGQTVNSKTVTKSTVFTDPLKLKSVTNGTTTIAGVNTKSKVVAYAEQAQDGKLYEYVSTNGSAYEKVNLSEYTDQLSDLDVDMYTNLKIVKKNVKVNNVNTVQISGEVDGTQIAEILGQMGLGEDAKNVDYSSLKPIKMTFWINSKNYYPVKCVMDMKDFMAGYIKLLYDSSDEDSAISYTQAKSTMVYKNLNKATNFTIPAECK